MYAVIINVMLRLFSDEKLHLKMIQYLSVGITQIFYMIFVKFFLCIYWVFK
jgi:hypothetical protein